VKANLDSPPLSALSSQYFVCLIALYVSSSNFKWRLSVSMFLDCFLSSESTFFGKIKWWKFNHDYVPSKQRLDAFVSLRISIIFFFPHGSYKMIAISLYNVMDIRMLLKYHVCISSDDINFSTNLFDIIINKGLLASLPLSLVFDL
jgi:hypothetical protein